MPLFNHESASSAFLFVTNPDLLAPRIVCKWGRRYRACANAYGSVLINYYGVVVLVAPPKLFSVHFDGAKASCILLPYCGRPKPIAP